MSDDFLANLIKSNLTNYVGEIITPETQAKLQNGVQENLNDMIKNGLISDGSVSVSRSKSGEYQISYRIFPQYSLHYITMDFDISSDLENPVTEQDLHPEDNFFYDAP